MARFRKGTGGNEFRRPANAGLATVQNQRFNQAVPKKVGDLAGRNVMAGDLTNVFNNFFNQVQGSIQNINNSYWAVEKMDAQKYADAQKAKATADAFNEVRNNPKGEGVTNQSYVTTALDKVESTNTHYIDTYKKSLGMALGYDMYNDFTTFSAQQPPEKFEENSRTWWNDNFKNGTGDEIVDTYASHAWQKNYFNDELKYKLETVKLQQTKKFNAIAATVPTYYANNTLEQAYFSLTSDLKKSFPHLNSSLSEGTIRSQAIGMLINGAKSYDDTMKLSTFINSAKIIDVPGAPPGTKQSLMERFPTEMAPLSRELLKHANNLKNLNGISAVTEWQSGYNKVIGLLQNDWKETLNMHSMLLSGKDYVYKGIDGKDTVIRSPGSLYNTPGVSADLWSAVNGDLTKNLNAAIVTGANVNKMLMVATGGKMANGMPYSLPSQEDTKNNLYNALTSENMNMMSDAEVSPGKIAANTKLLQQVYKTYGKDGFDGNTISYMTSLMLSENVDHQKAAVGVLLGIDGGNGVAANILLKDNPVAMANFNMIKTAINAPGATANLVRMNNDVQYRNAMALVSDPEGPYKGDFNKYVWEQAGNDIADYNSKTKTNFMDFKNDVADYLNPAWGVPIFGDKDSNWEDLTPTAQRLVTNNMFTAVMNLKQAGVEVNAENIADQLKNILGAQNFIINNGQIDIGGNFNANTTSKYQDGSATKGIPIGINVPNPFVENNTPENTVKNITELVENMDEILPNFDTSNWTLVTNGNPLLMANGLMSIRDKATSNEIGFNVGQVLDVYEGKMDGGNIVLGVDQDNKPILKQGMGSTWFSSFDPDTKSAKFTITGDYETDQANFKKFAHPAMVLVPMPPLDENTNQQYLAKGQKDDGSGRYVQITGYQLAVKPFFSEYDADKLNDFDLNEMINSNKGFNIYQKKDPLEDFYAYP